MELYYYIITILGEYHKQVIKYLF